MNAPFRLLLGPQRPVVNLGRAIRQSSIGDGPVAVISAAWQEAEGDIDAIRDLVDNPLSDLGIYRRVDEIFEADEALFAAYRQRQDRLKEQQRMYRLRLRQLSIAARAILRAEGDTGAIADERRHAISQLRALDRHHLRQIRKIKTEFHERINVGNHDLLQQHFEAVKAALADAETVLITGGNVVVLMNRLRLLGVDTLLPERHIVAWSAGAMALCDRIVLFHDRLPQGRRDPELMCEGLGIVPGTVLLPDARGRLRTSDLMRTSLFSRRFSPAVCLTLDNDAELGFSGRSLGHSKGVRKLALDGRLAALQAA